jgi:hypothetical protein
MMVDYASMESNEMVDACGADAVKWAKAFCQVAKKHKGLDVDEGWMIGWFANAIEHSYDVRMGRSVAILPDGSAFFTALVKEP